MNIQKTPFLPYIKGYLNESIFKTCADHQIRSPCDNHQLYAEVV